MIYIACDRYIEEWMNYGFYYMWLTLKWDVSHLDHIIRNTFYSRHIYIFLMQVSLALGFALSIIRCCFPQDKDSGLDVRQK